MQASEAPSRKVSDFADLDLDGLLDTKLVFSASKRVQSIEKSPNAISVVTAEDIRRMGAVTLMDVFRHIPGVYVYYREGTEPQLSIRGFTRGFPRGFLLVVDGVSLYSPTFGGVRWRDVPITVEDIERVELIRGPAGALYGSNGFSGVINVITKRPSDDASFRSVTTGGTQNKIDQFVSGAFSGENGGIRISGKFIHDQGLGNGTDGKPVHDQQIAGHFLARVDGKLNDRLSVGFSSAGRVANVDLPLNSGQSLPSENDTLFYYLTANASYKQSEATQYQLKTFFRYNSEYDPAAINRTRTPATRGFSDDTMVYDVEGSVTHSFNDNLNLLVGGHYRFNRAHAQQLAYLGFDLTNGFDPAASGNFSVVGRPVNWQHIAAAFARLDLEQGSWFNLNTAARYEFDSFTETPNLSANISAVLTPWEDHSFRIGTGRGIRLPTQIENSNSIMNFPSPTGGLATYTGNRHLRPETLTSFEAGYRGWYANRKIGFNAETFVSVLQDGVDLDGQLLSTSPYSIYPFGPLQVRTSSNTEKFTTGGVETELTVEAASWLNLRGNYTWLREFSKESNQGHKNTTPEHMFNVVADANFDTGTRLEAAGAFRSDFWAVEDTLGISTRVQKGFRLDLTASQELLEKKIRLSVIAKNITDSERRDFPTTATDALFTTFLSNTRIPRSFYGQMEIRL